VKNFQNNTAVFLKHTFYFLFHYPTRHSLYPRPKAWDAAAVWAKFERLYFHNIIFIIVPEQSVYSANPYQFCSFSFHCFFVCL
jgi:hypothetical protein